MGNLTKEDVMRALGGGALVGADALAATLEETVGTGARGAAIADIDLEPVTGVDGTGSNAASKADVDARLATIEAKVNAIIAALEAHGIIAT